MVWNFTAVVVLADVAATAVVVAITTYKKFSCGVVGRTCVS